MLGNAGGVAPEGAWERIASELALEQAGAVAPPGSAPALAPHPGMPAGFPVARTQPGDRDQAGTDGLLAADDALGRDRTVVALASGGRRPARRGGVTLAGVALGAVAAALAIVVGVLAARVSDLDHRVSQVQSALASPSLAEQALEASLEPGSVEVKLAPAPRPATPTAHLIVDRRSGTAYFVSTGLATLSADRTYQLWSLVGGKPVSIALLGSRPVASELHVSPNMSTFMVTAEPEGGTPQPTGPVLVQGTLPSST